MRHRKCRDGPLTLLEVESVDSHNNEVEKALRPTIVMRKNNYGMRSSEGVRYRAVLMNVSGSTKKKGEEFTAFARNFFSMRIASSTRNLSSYEKLKI
jgi:hypothetical protein